MWDVLKEGYQQLFARRDAVVLFLSLLGIALGIALLGHFLAPVLVSIVLAYLLNGLVTRLVAFKCPNGVAVTLTWFLSMGLVLVILIWLCPVLWRQLAGLFNELPHMLEQWQAVLLHFTRQYPSFLSEAQVHQSVGSVKAFLSERSTSLLSATLASIPGLLVWVIYLVLVPLLVFFFLKDRDSLLHWAGQLMPKDRDLLQDVWTEVDQQIANYIRGKAIEVLIVTVVSVFTFALLGLKYTVLLGVLVGLSVLIPFVGVTVVTVPVILVAYLQWGFTAPFAYLCIAYAVITILDGNVLVPVLFAEVMNLHPVAIIIAVLFFGTLFGFWGVFFAIPLATVIKAVYRVWPSLSGAQSR